ncbi:MAG: zinc ribbon domain-containing protein, partial [Candidatus Thermoplasmatota archaeon]
NFIPSRFTMGLARDEIDAAKMGGRDTAVAEGHLAGAQALFEQKDYDAALQEAVRARRSLEESPPAPTAPIAEAPAPSVPAVGGRSCVACGASIVGDDTFCRKCGARAPTPRLCASCGSEVPTDDAFCRKCGTGFPQANP